MAYEFNFGTNSDRFQEQLQAVSARNNKSDSEDSRIRREGASTLQMPKLEGMRIDFPPLNTEIKIPQTKTFISAQQKGSTFTPAPPVIRSESQKAIWKTVKKFSSKYEYIWVFIAEPGHPAGKDFALVYEAEKLSNVNHNLQNMLAPEDLERVLLFTREGLVVKVMADYYTYRGYLKRNIGVFESNPKIMEIFVQKDPETGLGAQTTKKTKNTDSLSILIQSQIKLEVEACRKDKPYYNFIHSNSGPELFNRRSIIKNCLSNKSQAQYIRNHELFVQMMGRYNRDERERRDQELRARGGDGAGLDKSRQIFEDWEQLKRTFQKEFSLILEKSYPVEHLPGAQKRELYNWILIQYCLQSAVYRVVNNTIRFSSNAESVNPISTYVKYLYDALRFHFTTRYRQITYNVVYRGARVSLVEQRAFVEGRNLWNLGFLSCSRSLKAAESFLARHRNNPQGDPNQAVLIIIKLSNLVNQLEYLWDQQGFFSMDRIPQISKYIKQHEEEVLFNPLNVFKIIKWDQPKKILTMHYAPHLEILEKKRQRMKLTEEEEDFLRSLVKLKDRDFDKGQQLLEEGDPGSAIKYYEQSDQTGSNLSFTQKSNYIKGLMEVGGLERMQTMLKDSLEQQMSAEKQLLSSTVASSASKISDSLQTLQLLQQTSDLITANKRASITAENSIKAPTQQSLLLEAQSYIQLAKARIGISETYDSIKESIRGLKIIDELAYINFCFRLWPICNDLRAVGKLRWDQKRSFDNLLFLLKDKKYFEVQIQEERAKAIRNIEKIRSWEKNQAQSATDESKAKSNHKKAEMLLNQYFRERDRRKDIQKFQQIFVKAYWQADIALIDREGLNQSQEIGLRQKLKMCQQKMFQVKNQYKQLFQREIAAYEILYRNIYKTSIDVSACLESYTKNIYARLEDFTNVEVLYEGESIDAAEVLWKHAEILYEYGMIIERPKMGTQEGKTRAEKLAELKMQETEKMIERIQAHQSRITGKNVTVYTYQKSELRRTIGRYFKSKIIDREQSRRLAVIKDEDEQRKSRLSVSTSTSSTQKTLIFQSLVSILKENQQLCDSDSSINKSLYKVRNANDIIQTINQSYTIHEENRSYPERLRLCRKQFEEVIATIDKYKERELMERNINMAHLYLLMAQNQFKLGLIPNSREYLRNSNACLKKALKIDEQEQEGGNFGLINKEKLLLGNLTHVGCLKLEAHIAAYFGSREQKNNTYELLRKKKKIITTAMNEPLSEAQLNQSLGLLSVNMVIMHKQLGYSYQGAKKPYLEAVKIRDSLLGPYNKHSAANYTMMVNMVAEPEIRSKHYKEICRFYEQALKIYDRIDVSADSNLVVYRMQLRATFLIFSLRTGEACQAINADLEEFFNCANKRLTLETAKQLYKCSTSLLGQQKYQHEGLKHMKRTYSYTAKLQEFVDKIYPQSGPNQPVDRKSHITKLKQQILSAIIKAEYKLYNQEVDEQYYSLYLQQKRAQGRGTGQNGTLL